MTYGNARHHNAALPIQKKYRGWKGRKDYLTFRKKVVKKQVRILLPFTHQKLIRLFHFVHGFIIIIDMLMLEVIWQGITTKPSVGIVEKIILRWHRKRVGLRGFHLDSVDESADEDIAKIFRKQRVDVALAEAVSRVLSMVNSTPARQQYRRMLQKYQQAKVSFLF